MSLRDRILARRAKFVAAALASAGTIGCSSTASVCLEPAIDASGTDTNKSDTTTRPEACLTPALDTGPEPCLEPPLDSGTADSTVSDTRDPDTGPAPCLKMPPPDGG